MLGDICGHAEYQVKHARGQSRVNKAAHRFDAGARSLLRCLKNKRAACGERPSDFARGRQHGKIPWREGGNDADWLRHYQLPRALDAARHDAAVAAAAFLGVPVDDISGGDHLGARLGIDLALLLHEHLRDRIVSLAHEVGSLAHDLGAVIGRSCSPQREAFLCGFQRFVEISLAGVRQMSQWLLGRRIEHVLALATAAVNPLAVDVEREIGIHGVLVVS